MVEILCLLPSVDKDDVGTQLLISFNVLYLSTAQRVATVSQNEVNIAL